MATILTSIQTPADVANNALTRLGFKLRVGSLLDGSDHARDILDVYGQTRDQLLTDFDYDFAQRTMALTLLKSAPPTGYTVLNPWNPVTNPPLGWRFEYAYPDSALKVRNLKARTAHAVNPDPRPHNFTEYNDNNYSPPQRTILSNLTGAICVYTGRITDPTTWDVKFAEALCAALARRIGPSLVSLDATKMEAMDEQVETAQSQMEGR